MRRREAEQDRDVAALLAARALVEIRRLAGSPRRADESPEEVLGRVRALADLGHNLPGIARPPRGGPARRGLPLDGFDRAMDERPMSWVWNTAGPEGRAWMLEHIGQEGRAWTPPPPLPQSRVDR
ncbi:hypothetical protein [Kitasatospora indigofera]|uniref:hypothetical protein n=1 Tax=Kitasatospora indigofera TaxID=67307 RepID=UPI0033AF6360